MEIQAEQSPVVHMKMLHRAHQLSLVQYAATYATTFYQQAKDYSPLVNSTLNMAESGARLAGFVATPVVTPFDGTIHTVEDIACETLNGLDNRYPCISMEAEEVSTCILDAGPSVSAGAEFLESTPTPGQLALMGLAGYLRIASNVADLTLPDDKSEKSLSNIALVNVAVLLDMLYSRIYRQSAVQLQQLQEVSTKILDGLQSHLAALELATKEIPYGIKDQTEKLWQQLQSTTHNLHQQTIVVAGQISNQLHEGTAAAAQRTLQLAQQISAQLVSLYAAAASSATNLPAAVQSALLKSKSHADRLYLQLSQVAVLEDIFHMEDVFQMDDLFVTEEIFQMEEIFQIPCPQCYLTGFRKVAMTDQLILHEIGAGN